MSQPPINPEEKTDTKTALDKTLEALQELANEEDISPMGKAIATVCQIIGHMHNCYKPQIMQLAKQQIDMATIMLQHTNRFTGIKQAFDSHLTLLLDHDQRLCLTTSALESVDQAFELISTELDMVHAVLEPTLATATTTTTSEHNNYIYNSSTLEEPIAKRTRRSTHN